MNSTIKVHFIVFLIKNDYQVDKPSPSLSLLFSPISQVSFQNFPCKVKLNIIFHIKKKNDRKY
jgi:hypothetical protein